MYKGSNWTRGDLGAEPEQPSHIDCADCGEAYSFEEYWTPRYIDTDEPTPPADEWVCDDCAERSKHERLNASLEVFADV